MNPVVNKLVSPEALSDLLAVGWPVAVAQTLRQVLSELTRGHSEPHAVHPGAREGRAGLTVDFVSRVQSTGWQPHSVRGFFAAVVPQEAGAAAGVGEDRWRNRAFRRNLRKPCNCRPSAALCHRPSKALRTPMGRGNAQAVRAARPQKGCSVRRPGLLHAKPLPTGRDRLHG